MIGLYRLIRQSSLGISFVVMGWVPLMFAVVDTLPLVQGQIQRERMLVQAALKIATPLRRLELLVTVLLLMPVLVFALFIDTWPALAANIRLQCRIWLDAHRRNWNG
jgi:hypothetical protein